MNEENALMRAEIAGHQAGHAATISAAAQKETFMMLQEPDGDTNGMDLLETREALCRAGQASWSRVLDVFNYRSDDTGMHCGHLIARLGLVGLAEAFVTRHIEQWRLWMNAPTFTMKPPARWTCLMCFMEHARPRARDDFEAMSTRKLISAIVDNSTMATVMIQAYSTGGTFVHMARSVDHLTAAMNCLYNHNKPIRMLINVPNTLGHSAYDLHWNNGLIKEVIEAFGGHSLRPMPGAHGKGKKGSGKGKGSADGLGPEHHWNRQYHK